MSAALASVVVVAFSLAIAATRSYVARVSGLDPIPCHWPPTPKREGVFAANKVLQGLEKIGVGQLPGPEDIAVDDTGMLYTGCADGWIKKIHPESHAIENWAHVGGHPLGVLWGLNGELLVCEPTRGLLNVTQGKVEVLSEEADGTDYRLADALAVARDGTIYFSDASNKFTMKTSDLDILECRPNGRLLKYDPATRTTTVLLKNLYFANGVALSSKQDFLVFCETSMMRCQKYWLEGDKKGTTEIFIDNLPGHPDNIKHNGHDRFWIGLVSKRDRMIDFIFRMPFLKQLIMLPLPTALLEKVSKSTKMAKVLAVSEAGKPLAFYEDPTAVAIAFVTTALQVGDDLYLGGLATSYIGKLRIPVSS